MDSSSNPEFDSTDRPSKVNRAKPSQNRPAIMVTGDAAKTPDPNRPEPNFSRPATPKPILPRTKTHPTQPPQSTIEPSTPIRRPNAPLIRNENREQVPTEPARFARRRSNAEHVTSDGSRPTRRPAATKEPGMGGLYFLLASASLMFGIWFIGPRLVEEYHYAATMGRTRGEYDNAVNQLEKMPLGNVSQAYQLVAQRIRPSVVSINAVKSRRDGSGLGSGVIMSDDGYIMTNAHVLEGAEHFSVELHDRRRYEATLIGIDTTSDLAVLKISAPNLIPADWGDSEAVNVGSIVWAIGSPYGFQQTVTSGIISGKDRPGDPQHRKQSLLQTDAAVNPGNSGGPLVDAQGQVIGINTSIFGETFQGISFAVPSETAKFVFQELIDNGTVTRGYLGVLPAEVDYHDAVQMQLPDLHGAKLRDVVAGSPAHRAGIRPNDIIRSWNGTDIKEFKNLFRLAETTRPNTLVKVTLLRDGEERQTDVIVGTPPVSFTRSFNGNR